jgi:transcriptional regulator with XRE-family HTH domain
MSTRSEKFSDKEYRAAYAESFLDTYIATQLRVLREERELTQEALAGVAEMKQSRISTMEDANYSGWSIKTLKRLAKAFDLALIVKFESFGGLLAEMDRFNRANLSRPSFKDDPSFKKSAGPTVVSDSTGTRAVVADTATARVLPFRIKRADTSATVCVTVDAVNVSTASHANSVHDGMRVANHG